MRRTKEIVVVTDEDRAEMLDRVEAVVAALPRTDVTREALARAVESRKA